MCTKCVEFDLGADVTRMRAEVDAFVPHVVVVHRPEILPPGVFEDLPAPVVGFLTDHRPPATLDRAGIDRVVSHRPLAAPLTADAVEVWRSMPVPVADTFYRPVLQRHSVPRVLFVGTSTERRERWLLEPKERLDVTHVPPVAGPAELERLLDEHDITVNLRADDEDDSASETGVLAHLAAGHLVITEPLGTTHGLEAGIDYLEVGFREDLLELAAAAQAFPAMSLRVRVRGRAKAELFRASKVWSMLVADLFDDLRVFGTHRRAGR